MSGAGADAGAGLCGSAVVGWVVTLALLAVVLVSSVAPAIRAGLYARDCLMYLCGILARTPVRVVNEMDGRLIEQVLQSRDKGRFLEDLHACGAWAPIYSVESTNGETWRRLKKTVHLVYRHVDYKRRLPDIAHRVLSRHFAGRCDSAAVGGATAAVLFELVTGSELAPADAPQFLAAAHEWKKELAVKAPGDKQVKLDFLLWMQDAIRKSELGRHVDFDCNSIYDLSAVLQPFIISPVINVPDVFAAIEHHLRKNPGVADAVRDPDSRRCLLLEVMRLSHPFPVLERTLERDEAFAPKGTHFFINLDVMKQDQTFDPSRWAHGDDRERQDTITGANTMYSAIPFGAGPRACVGKHLAMDLLDLLLEHFGQDMSPQAFNPIFGHSISGRTNDDKANDEEAGVWQAGVFATLMYKSLVGWQFPGFPNPLPGAVAKASPEFSDDDA